MLHKPLYKVSLVAKDGQHFYEVDGISTLFNGVTGILDVIGKPQLISWSAGQVSEYVGKILMKLGGHNLTPRFKERLVSRAKKQPKFTKESAARKGSHAHNQFDLHIRGVKDDSPRSTHWESFLYWLNTEKLKIVCGDTKVASVQYQYGGSLDILLKDEAGEYVIGDFKTGKRIYDSHALQVAAYSQAFKETYGLSYRPRGIIIRTVDDKQKYERREIRSIDDSFKAFKTALELRRLLELTQFQNTKTVKPTKTKEKHHGSTIPA